MRVYDYVCVRCASKYVCAIERESVLVNMCAYVCMCEFGWCVFVCLFVCLFVCVRDCDCVCTYLSVWLVYVYVINQYVRVCQCVCVCVGMIVSKLSVCVSVYVCKNRKVRNIY